MSFPPIMFKTREKDLGPLDFVRFYTQEHPAHPVRHFLIDISATAAKTLNRVIHGPVPPIQDLAAFYGIPYTWHPTDDHPDEDRHTPDMAVFTNAAGESLEVFNVHRDRADGDWVDSRWGRPYGRQIGYYWLDLSETGALSHFREITDWFDMLQRLIDFGADVPAESMEDIISASGSYNHDRAYWGGPMKRVLKEPDPTQKWVRTLNDWAEALECQ